MQIVAKKTAEVMALCAPFARVMIPRFTATMATAETKNARMAAAATSKFRVSLFIRRSLGYMVTDPAGASGAFVTKTNSALFERCGHSVFHREGFVFVCQFVEVQAKRVGRRADKPNAIAVVDRD